MSASTKNDDNLQSWLEAIGLYLYEKAMLRHKEGKVWNSCTDLKATRQFSLPDLKVPRNTKGGLEPRRKRSPN